MSMQHASVREARAPERRYERPNERETLRRLATLHDEAAETAKLANVLGRVPWLVAVIAMAATVAFAYATGLDMQTGALVWMGMTLVGCAVLLRLYRHAIRAPFELKALRGFAADLRAVLLYAGCAWGAGIFLADPQDNILMVLVFSVGMAIVIELILRAPRAALYFVAPAVIVPALAAAWGSLGADSACLIAAAGACVIAGADVAGKLLSPRAKSTFVTVP